MAENTIPGTKYATLEPQGQTGQTTWSNPPQGEGVKIAEGLEKMGRVISAYALNVKNQEIEVEKSQGKRLIDERGWEAYNAVTGDDAADKKAWDKFQADAKAIANSSKYQDVNSSLQIYVNDISPKWEQNIHTASITKQKENVADQFDFEGQKHLENGDLPAYNELNDKRLELGSITKEKRDKLKSTALGDSVLAKVNALLTDNPKMALTILDSADSQQIPMTTDQKKQKEILRLTAEKKADEIDRKTINNVFDKVLKGMPLKDVTDLVKQDTTLDAKQKIELIDQVTKAAKIAGETGRNPFTITQDYELFWDLKKKAIDGQLTLAQIRPLVGDKISMANYDELSNIIEKGAEGLQLVEMGYQDRLFDVMSGGKKTIPNNKKDEWNRKQQQITEAVKRNPQGGATLDKEVQDIIGQVKEENAKNWLWELVQPRINILDPLGTKKAAQNILQNYKDPYQTLIDKYPDKKVAIEKARANGYSASEIEEALK